MSCDEHGETRARADHCFQPYLQRAPLSVRGHMPTENRTQREKKSSGHQVKTNTETGSKTERTVTDMICDKRGACRSFFIVNLMFLCIFQYFGVLPCIVLAFQGIRLLFWSNLFALPGSFLSLFFPAFFWSIFSPSRVFPRHFFEYFFLRDCTLCIQVLTKCSLCSYHQSLTRSPHAWLTKTINDK